MTRTRPRVRGVSAVLAAGLPALAMVWGPAAALAGPSAALVPTATTYVVQGVPDAEVDVSVDGRVVRSSLPARRVVPLADLAPGRHTVEFRTSDWNVSATVETGRGSHDVVLHWPADEAREPVVTTFRNDVSAVAAGEGRLSVAHTAVVPPADILASGEVLFSNIANGEFVTAEVPSDTYAVAVVPTGSDETEALLGPVDLPVEAGSLTRVFAIGAPRSGSMDAVVQVIPLGRAGTRPSTVDTGSAGLVAPGARPAGPQEMVAGLVMVLLVAAGLRAATARRERCL